MTIITVTTILILGLVYLFYKQIRKFNKYIYGLCLIIGIISFTQETTIINMGYVGLSFFLVVMFTGVIDKSEMKKRLAGTRAELAIIGTIFVFVHALKFIVFAIDYGFLWTAPFYFYLGVASVFIVIPLFITSFLIIRKKMKGKTWKNLHKLSYLFYLLVGLHLVFMNNERIFFYIGIFAVYLITRIWTYFEKKLAKKPQPKPIQQKTTQSA